MTYLKCLYVLIIICMGVATFVEKSRGTQFAAENIYGAWWFVVLWALLTVTAVVHIVRRRVRRVPVVLLHLSFVIILAGALLTHLTAERGIVHLRQGETTGTYLVQDGDDVSERQLPFGIRLDRFEVAYHEGTASAADYISHITVTDGTSRSAVVSMNCIYSHSGVRLYQSNYDPDLQGSTLALNADPWGIPVTYLGYGLLFIAFIWTLADPHGTFRRLLRATSAGRVVLCLVLVVAQSWLSSAVAATSTTSSGKADEPPVLPKETAEEFGRLYVLHKGRICPIQTLAVDFTRKLCGRKSYKGLTSEQVFTGFILWSERWRAEPIIKMKRGPLRETLMLPDYCSVNTFFNPDMGGYILGPYVRESMEGVSDKFHKDVMAVDDRLMMIMEYSRGTSLKMFPYTADGSTTWYAPTDKPAATVPANHLRYIAGAIPLLVEAAEDGDMERVEMFIGKMKRYQEKNGGVSLPSPLQTKAERIYNAVPFATILFMVNLTLGVVMLAVVIRRMTVAGGKTRAAGNGGKPGTGASGVLTGTLRASVAFRCCCAVMVLSLATLTTCEALRWIISGTIPMSNGYETMLFVAWVVMAVSLAVARRFRIALTFGFLMSGFFLLVSHIGQMDPNISYVMPVLNSPLLSLHVSAIMFSFALLAMTFICGVTAIVVTMTTRGKAQSETVAVAQKSLRTLSLLFLYPALATLAAGIFIGAVWANVSWGTYWSWDPKEVWALITMMVYAVGIHAESMPSLRRPLVYHVFMTATFLTVLMTYFGVNYVLGGMHSYA